MNTEQFHDALSGLPDDLIAEADARRQRKVRAIPLRRYVSLAACFAAVLAVSLFAVNTVSPKGTAESELRNMNAAGSAVSEEMAAAPLAPAAGEENDRNMKNEAAQESPAEYTDAANAAAETVPGEAFDAPLDFAVRLLQNTAEEEENTLVSPLSVVSALGMTMNGADGRTLEQMANTLSVSPESLNTWNSSRMEEDPHLKQANALWIRNDGSLSVEEAFLETNASYYHADIFETAFDSAALAAINSWVAEKTGQMIPKLLSQLPENAVMCLINALAFEAEWETPYQGYRTLEGTFTTESGLEQPVTMMNSTESVYLEDAHAVGFVKYYADRRYAFAAVLPREGISVSDYLSSLSGSSLHALLESASEATVQASLPKFQLAYEAELSEALKAMGMADAFDASLADFGRLGHSAFGNLYISRVQHKTAITVAEEGTKAAAATSMVMANGAALPPPDLKIVTLDRPFIYMLIDCRDNYPVFLGTMMDMSENMPAK